jgi:hypothetical protein
MYIFLKNEDNAYSPFYFFTVLLNYGIIKVIESYTYKGFEGKSPGESEDTK